MAVKIKIRRFLRQKKGDSAVEFVMTAAMLILIFATLVSAMIYVTRYYSASYICRRAVRTIEIAGEYDENAIRTLADELGGDALEDMEISVDATYCRGRRIQLRDEFTLRLRAKYCINIIRFGDTPVSIELPIQIRLSGRSEVYWK